MKVGMLFYNPLDVASTRLNMQQHISMFESVPNKVEIIYANVASEIANYRDPGIERNDIPAEFEALSDCEAVVIHYSLLNLRYLGIKFWAVKRRLQWIVSLKAHKVAIPQDEGDSYLVLDDWLMELGVRTVFSVHYRPERKLYPRLRNVARIENCLPGYITPDDFSQLSLEPLRDRQMDVFYRGRNLPFSYGCAGRWKGGIAASVESHKSFSGSVLDLSTKPSEVITGDEWLVRLASAKATLGSPGGFSVLDRRGEVKLMAEQVEAIAPAYDDFCKLMPAGWDDSEYFTITPRHLEAGMTRTAQLLIRSDYSGLLKPDIHYVPIERDFSNLSEVAERLLDVSELDNMAGRVYDELSRNQDLRYATFAERILKVIADQMNDPTTQPFRSDEGGLDFEPVLVTLSQMERSLERIADESAQQTVAIREVSVSTVSVHTQLAYVLRRRTLLIAFSGVAALSLLLGFVLTFLIR